MSRADPKRSEAVALLDALGRRGIKVGLKDGKDLAISPAMALLPADLVRISSSAVDVRHCLSSLDGMDVQLASSALPRESPSSAQKPADGALRLGGPELLSCRPVRSLSRFCATYERLRRRRDLGHGKMEDANND
jgi:hypothetical protein